MPYSKRKNESLLDEFESMFEAAVHPSFEVGPAAITRILAVYDGSPRATQAATLAVRLAERFGATLTEVAVGDAPAPDGRTADPIAGDATGAIAARIAELPADLVILPCPLRQADEPAERHSLGAAIDTLLAEVDVPFLLVKTDTPQTLDSVLVHVPGTIGIQREFSLAFALVADGGRLELYHVVDDAVLDAAAVALEVAPEVETERGRDAVREGLQKRVRQLLADAASAARDRPFELATRIDVGAPVALAVARAAELRPGLVVLRVGPGQREALDFLSEQIARELTDVLVLVV